MKEGEERTMKDMPINLSEMIHKIQDDVKRLVKGFSDIDLAAYAMGHWVPHADMVEGKGEVRVLVDLPGISVEGVDVTLMGSELKIEGEKPARIDVEGYAPLLAERRTGRFSRKFALPFTVDPYGVSASMQNGLLEIRLPKVSASAEQEVKVEVK
ncbi:MAG: Hsp20/alpha crystallin family protein [Planctomycetota bacterium]|jgi:HSP20 family protein